MVFLSDHERTQLIVQHRRERDKRICDRIQAVLLFDKDWPIPSIAEALFLSEDAIRNHIAEYRDSKKLKPENGGSTQKLSIEHSNKLATHLRNHAYLYVKDITAYVQSTWKITYPMPSMRNWLRAMASPTKNLRLCQATLTSSNNEIEAKSAHR